MQFRIADTFTDSLARLTGEEQRAAKTTAFDLQMNPASPGLSFHKLDKAKDKNFWSVRVNGDIRLIVHKTQNSLLLCYVDHHDPAYAWGERRKLETHPVTGAAQFVEIRERVHEVMVPVYRPQEVAPRPKSPLFAGRTDEEILSWGVPPEWLADVRLATEADVLLLAERLPGEAAEALLEVATGGRAPQPVPPSPPGGDPFAHPDALRRFRVVENVADLERALEFPWDKWTVFLHPEQRGLVERDFAGSARVAGSAGTGKTIVALHRAVTLARRNPDARVLLATFSDTLAYALRTRLRRLVGNEPKLAERIDVEALDSLGRRLHERVIGPVRLASLEDVRGAIRAASTATPDHKFSEPFLRSEWEHVVDGWQLDGWVVYRPFPRLGRKSRLSEAQRKTFWSIFELARADLSKRVLVTAPAMFTALADAIRRSGRSPYDFVVVDEAQDLGVAQLRFLAALGGDRANGLFLAGDLGQQIFQQPFSWKSVGVNVQGRSRTLRVNYRTSHQIRQQADRLLDPELTDLDGNVEDRRGTVSLFNGPAPQILVCDSVEDEQARIGDWLRELSADGMPPHEIAVFVRSPDEVARAEAAVKLAGLSSKVLDEHVETASGFVSISTMHLAKGLEFRAVAVMACDDDVLPLRSRIQSVGDQGDLRDTYETERQLLYVACTRARDHLVVTGVDPESEFLDDLRGKGASGGK